ncbi:hypothetical protein GQ53DRAFT_804000 [Thozetella sp. PMI_491]|nr:hypothetical protein GQ53DRAFT_804000 [Thozetella sp. PMI_491]
MLKSSLIFAGFLLASPTIAATTSSSINTFPVCTLDNLYRCFSHSPELATAFCYNSVVTPGATATSIETLLATAIDLSHRDKLSCLAVHLCLLMHRHHSASASHNGQRWNDYCHQRRHIGFLPGGKPNYHHYHQHFDVRFLCGARPSNHHHHQCFDGNFLPGYLHCDVYCDYDHYYDRDYNRDVYFSISQPISASVDSDPDNYSQFSRHYHGHLYSYEHGYHNLDSYDNCYDDRHDRVGFDLGAQQYYDSNLDHLTDNDRNRDPDAIRLFWKLAHTRLGGDTETISTTAYQSKYALAISTKWTGSTGGVVYGQTLSTTKGVTYRLSFDLMIGAFGINTWQVAVGNSVLSTGTSVLGNGWATYSGTFTAAGSDVLNLNCRSTFLFSSATYYFDNFVAIPLSYT